jgi:capsular polysaccharide transport system permease protein
MRGTRGFGSLIDGGPVSPGGKSPDSARLSARAADMLPRFGLLDHLFIVRALILRDIKFRHFKTRLGFIVELIQPIVVIVVHYYVFKVLGRVMPAKIPVELFILAAFPVWFVYSHTARRNSRREERPGGMLIPGVTQIHFLVAAAAWECAVNILIMFGGLALSELLLGDEPVPNVLAGILIFPVMAVLGTGSRLIFEAFGDVWPIVQDLKRPLTWLLFITSGIYFVQTGHNSLNLLTEFSWYNPLLHCIESERHALYPGYPVAGVTLLYPIAWGLGLTFLGLMLNRSLPRWFPE